MLFNGFGASGVRSQRQGKDAKRRTETDGPETNGESGNQISGKFSAETKVSGVGGFRCH